jgi:hypothetical protein
VYWNGSSWGTLAGNNTTTGLLEQTNAGVPSWVSGSAVTPLVFPPPTRPGDVVYWSGSAWLALPGNNSGSQFLSENASGTPSWVTAAVFPSTTNPGDIMYWNSTAWVTLPGNTAGTKTLTENATGVPSWTTPGTVTSVTAGTGLSGGVITAAGTISLNISYLAASLPNDVSLTSTTNYFIGPSVSQGTTGTWWASGTVTLSDTVAASFSCKLSDGTTIISSGLTYMASAGTSVMMTLSGAISSPTANIRIECKDITAITGKILFNATGNSKDSTISVARIQ